MLIYTHRYWVQYGDLVKGCKKRYAVTDHRDRPQQAIFASDYKSECIAEAQKRNGFTPVDGNETTYSQQCKSAMRDHSDVKHEDRI